MSYLHYPYLYHLVGCETKILCLADEGCFENKLDVRS